MIGRSEFDSVEEAEAAIALYSQLLCSLIRNLADRQLLDKRDVGELAEAIERFCREDEHLPAVVERHAGLLAAFLRGLPHDGAEKPRSDEIADPGTDVWHEGP